MAAKERMGDSAYEDQKGWVSNFEELGQDDVARVGGKNASLGELTRNLAKQGISVPVGFATTSDAYWHFVEVNGIKERIADLIEAWQTRQLSLSETGSRIRNLFIQGEWPSSLRAAICQAYQGLSMKAGTSQLAVAVRSSATAEDLPDASFAGQQETYLNVVGCSDLLDACRRCCASLFTDRAITYRQTKGFEHLNIALSIGIQRMVRSDAAGSGVMFSIDTESGFDKIVLINAAWGLGENIVQGTVDPDEYQIFKPLLKNALLTPIIGKKRGAKQIKMVYGDEHDRTQNVPTSLAERESYVLNNEEILQLARWACTIEQHYQRPMDIEWAKDGLTNELLIVQARPETVHTRRAASILKTYHVKNPSRLLAKGCAVGDQAVVGRVCVIEDVKDLSSFVEESILVTKVTDPDWVPVMKKARAIITDHGGRTSHAAIISRELGLPAVVGTGSATYELHTGQEVTVSCAQGDVGFVYAGRADITVKEIDLGTLPETETQIMLNLGNPSSAFRWWKLPCDGIGLARAEFVISNMIGIHPMALVKFEELRDITAQRKIQTLTRQYSNKSDYFVEKFAEGLGSLCATVYPRPAIIRMSDFKSNEYANLLGGKEFELMEENPMIGLRGASRYYSPRYVAGFALECQAIQRLRENLGFDNAIVMIPFCRTVEEAQKVLDTMSQHGLERGKNGLQVYMMCEIPSNVILASDFAKYFDGFSIGSNDLTQLTLGVDRDSSALTNLFDEGDKAAKWMISKAIQEARKAGRKVGFCGQAPSNHPSYAEFLVLEGIDSISVTPDTFFEVKKYVHRTEQQEKENRGQGESNVQLSS